jgi:hypothetical protein
MEGMAVGIQDGCKAALWHVTNEHIKNSTELANLLRVCLPIGTKYNTFCTHSGFASARRITVLVWVQNPVDTARINEVMESEAIVKDIDYPRKEDTLGDFIQKVVGSLYSDVLGSLAGEPVEKILGLKYINQGCGYLV